MAAEETTENDEALARALQQQLDQEARQRRRSQNRRRLLSNQATNNLPASAAASSDARTRETSSDQRVTPSSAPLASPSEVNSASGRPSWLSRARGTTVERSQHGQSRTTAAQSRTAQSNAAPPDTSGDEELARKLSQRGSGLSDRSQRGQMSRTARNASNQNGVSPDARNDEQLARRLQQQEEQRSSRQSRPAHRGRPPALSSLTLAQGTEVQAARGATPAVAPTTASGLDPPTSRGRSRSRPAPARTRSRSRPRSRSRTRSKSRPRSLTRARSSAESPSPFQQTTQSKLDDEALARKLDQELQDEELAHRLSSHEESHGKRQAAYLARRARNREAAKLKEDDGRPSTPPTSPPSETFENSGDEGPTDRYTSTSRSRSSSLERSLSRSQSHPRPGTSSHYYASGVVGVEQAPTEDDLLAMEVARRLEQEDADQQYAMRLLRQENRGRVPLYQIDSRGSATPRRRWTMRRCCSLAVPVVIIVAAVVGLAFAFSEGDGIPSLTGSNPPIFEDDPFEGTAPEDANRWNTQQSGLSLVIQNALDDNWETIFTVSVSEWDQGNPDALTLITERVAVDPNCQKVTGKLKVCNGDYGETRWRGINQVLLNNGFIVSSVAKLNEFYLGTADNAQRQYTMCHEIGHGFGLPHTDENFFNADTFNCMDYTSNPEANKSPSEDNFSFLYDLYGVVRRGLLRWKGRGPNTNVVVPKTPMDADMDELIKKVVASIENDHLDTEDTNYISVVRMPHTRRVAYKLSDRYELRVSMLLAEPSS